MEKTGKRKELLLLFLVIALLGALALNLTIYYARIDLTKEKVFTLTEVSKTIFDQLEDQVQITYYVSEKLEKYSTVPENIRDVLEEYKAYAKGNMQLRFIDPDKSGLAPQVESLGILPRQMEIVERNEKSYTNIYSGLVIQYLDQFETLPFVVSTDTLEYQITRLIRQMASPEDYSIAVLVGDTTRSLEEDYSGALGQLRELYQVEEIKVGDAVDPETDVLVVFGNRDIRQEDLLPLEDYIVSGGNVLFCLEGVSIDMMRNLTAEAQRDSPLLNMVSHYGVTVEPSLVLDRYAKDFRVPRQIFGQMAWQIMGPYPHWITILPTKVDKTNPITSRLMGLDLLWPSPLRLEKRESLESSVLISSSDKAWLMKDQFTTDPQLGEFLLRGASEETESYPLGVLITGRFPRTLGSGTALGLEARVIVLGDADFASNIIQYSDSYYNLLFLENTVEWLAQDDDLLQIKTRSLTDTRLNKQDPEKTRSLYVTAQVVNVALIPLGVFLFGIIRGRNRRNRRKEVRP